jgi:hypothetical protein
LGEGIDVPKATDIEVRDLGLDLANYRTIRQPSEQDAVDAMVSASPDYFWALAESLLTDGYLPTESIQVLRDADGDSSLTVREGNRRVAVLKLIHGLVNRDQIEIPETIEAEIALVTPKWRKENSKVPCTLYEAAERDLCDRVVARCHGKGEKAGRQQWPAVARARHGRDAQNKSEPALDLLEAYLRQGRNLIGKHASSWAGDYPLSVLADAMKRLAPRLGCGSARELADAYPKIKKRDALEQIINDIGIGLLKFPVLRAADDDFAKRYGIESTSDANNSVAVSIGGSADTRQKNGSASSKPKPSALSMSDPKRVKAILRTFSPKGQGREKVVDLRTEARELAVRKTPLAFCFVLRSMFELSARAYCDDYASAGGPKASKADGSDRRLVDILRDVHDHLVTSSASKVLKKRELHGAMTELGRSEGLLSVTSMNQLIHNPSFLIGPADISLLFGTVYPLLEAMNA